MSVYGAHCHRTLKCQYTISIRVLAYCDSTTMLSIASTAEIWIKINNGNARFPYDSMARYCAMQSKARHCHGKLSMMLSLRGHRGWNTSKIILWLISLGCPLSAHINSTDLLRGNHPQITAGVGIR